MSDSDVKLNPSSTSQPAEAKTNVVDDKTGLKTTADPRTILSHEELLDQARQFLRDESVRDASRERKVIFLQKKGVSAEDIEQLLDEKAKPANNTLEINKEIKTVHDSNATEASTSTSIPELSRQSQESSRTSYETTRSGEPQQSGPTSPNARDIPPIITYPEFLLKPQKPPPLITFSRLVNATYAFAGFAGLTYTANKYLIDPMVTSLTQARHSLAETTIQDLEKLNERLESSVSHIPYIASAAARKSLEQKRLQKGAGGHTNSNEDDDDDAESVISDPTELFHRDVATQTSPSLTRTSSFNDDGYSHYYNDNINKSNNDANPSSSTTSQELSLQHTNRLTSLHETLNSLTASLDPKEIPYFPASGSKRLHDTISDFQTILDKLESTYNPLRGDYYSILSSNSNSNSYSNNNSIYASADKSRYTNNNTIIAGANANKDGSNNNSNNNADIVAKVKAEIRSLKGAFLSARNFPTAPRPQVNSYMAGLQR